MGTAMIGTGEATGERRALRAAEGAIANPLFDDTSLRGARGLLISITGGKDLTLYEVDEAASRIRQEVDEEANIIVGAIVEPALEEALRVSVVATGIDQTANFQIEHMSAQSSAEPLLRPGAALLAPNQTARTPFSIVETHPPISVATEIETPPLPSPVIPFPEPAERRRILDEETRLTPPAIRRPTLLGRLATAALERRQASGWR
jgi:cell division protein FtsZ